MKITKTSYSKIQKLTFITVRELPREYMIVNLSEGLSLECKGDNVIVIRKNKEVEDADI